MGKTERRQLTAEPGSTWWDDQTITEAWTDERNVSHSKPCWMCGKGSEARRKQRSKPRRAQDKKAIREGLNDE